MLPEALRTLSEAPSSPVAWNGFWKLSGHLLSRFETSGMNCFQEALRIAVEVCFELGSLK